MNQIVNYDQYLKLNGLEEFRGVLNINNDIVSLDLESVCPIQVLHLL